ncbi:MAG: Holliday junction resolvase RuvX [Chloroflexi bacterium]|nr:Holliday junction resolvase RuvX [Chloroflexota bacterium]
MALDVGERRIGVALSDPLLILASPLTTFARKNLSADIEVVLGLITDHEVNVIVVGLPLSLNGKEGPQAKLTRKFTDVLEAQSPVPVRTFDERFSSFEAEQLLRDAGKQPSRDKGSIDSAAAAVILQRYLDKLRK